jgi:tetratricopeptide (TPR) repeat protein
VKQAVTDALEFPEPERAAFLVRTCPDAAVHAEAERLLRACERASSMDSLLDVPVAQFAASLVAEVDARERVDVAALQAELAGRYTIERELGRGGMATVYLARDERHSRHVALKVVHAGLTHQTGGLSALRFEREIEIAARLAHPHILPLHDSGTAAGMLFYIMPYVDGASLRDRLARGGPQPLDVTLRVLSQVTRALAHAHRQGVVHRDIKPGNILLNQDGDALVSDFGIATALAAVSNAETREDTAPGASDVVFGTVGYSAPEQVRGNLPVDQRADLYSLGVVAYEMLAGSRPFTGRAQPLQAADVPNGPEPLATRRPDVPPTLANLVMQLLATSPDNRPQDTTEVLRILDQAAAGGAMKGASPAVASHRLRRRLVLAGGLPLLMLAPWLAATLWQGDGRGSKSDQAFELTRRGNQLATMRDYDNLIRARDYYEQAITQDSSFAQAHAGLADVYVMLGVMGFARPHEVFPKGIRAAEKALALDDRLVGAQAVLAHAKFVYEFDWEGAEAAFKKAFAMDSRYALAHRFYGMYLHSLGRHEEAREHIVEAGKLDQRTSVVAEQLIGLVYVNIGQPDSAIFHLQQALNFDSGISLAHQQLAHAYLQKGMHAEAIAAMQRASALSGARDSAQLAYILAATGRRAEARQVLQKLLDSRSQRYLPEFHIAMAYGGLGDVDEAFRWLETGYHERGSFMQGLAVAAGFESIRADPRFDQLLRKMKLPTGLAAPASSKSFHRYSVGADSFGVYIPPLVDTLRGVLLMIAGAPIESRAGSLPIIRGGPNTSNEVFDDSTLREWKQKLRQFADDQRFALLAERVTVSSLAVGGADMVRRALDTLAQIVSRPELQHAPLFLFGHSAGACPVVDFAAANPLRVLGFIASKHTCHPFTVSAANAVPGYLLMGELDTEAGNSAITESFERNRQAGAVWALAVQPGSGHEYLFDVDLFIEWMNTVAELRLPRSVTPGQPVVLRPIGEARGWLANRQTLEIGPFNCYSGNKSTAAWLPSLQTARRWQALVSQRSVSAVSRC